MARIRTIKPEFFRHEGLQDLEIANPGMYPMMVFEALWGHCDSKGRFEWKPRMLKLDILPFIPFDMAKTLDLLERAGMLHRYLIDGKEYGLIDTFEKHQRLSGKELTEGEKFPEPTEESIVKQSGSVWEIPESQEWNGREEEKEGKGNTSPLRCEVSEIFDFWKSAMGHDRAKLDSKRKKQIANALKLGYTEEDLKNAITGCSLSAYHMGDNDKGARYDGLDLILRDAGKIDQFIGYFKSPPVKQVAQASKTQYQINQEATTRALFGSMLPGALAKAGASDPFQQKVIEGEVMR